VGLACVLTALGLGGGTAGAQLPELPRTDPLLDQPVRRLAEPVRQVAEPLQLGESVRQVAEPVRQVAEPLQLDEPVERLVEPLQRMLNEPLPSPLEEVVRDSPLEPVRAEVRRIVGSPGGGVPGEDPTGDGLPRGGSSAGGNPPASDAGAGSPASPVTHQLSPGGEGGAGSGRTFRGGSGGADAGGGSSSARTGGDGRADRTSGADDRGTDADSAGSGSGDAPDSAPEAERTAGRGDAPSTQEDDDGPIARTVERIVEVVPSFVWVALGVLSLLALALFARSHVDRRRARALRRERERLLRDMGLLERVLLPRVPERMGDLAVSVAYRPAAGPAAGGDFYDVFELSGGRVGLFVGDVSGHGREALESTSSLRPALRGHLEAGLSPRAALASAGRAAGIDPSGRFTTALVAVHDPASGTLTYAQAGHPPPVLVGPGVHEPITVTSSAPIGVGLRTGKRQTTVPLPRGASACFVTDGLLEARAGDTLLGREWLERVVSAFGPLDSAEALLDRVFESADVVSDDMTACLVRAVDGPSAPGPRIEELELAPDDVGAPAPGRFLEACGVPAEAVEDVLVEARRLVQQAGKALLTVTIDGGGASVTVTAPTREALATT
jgi:Stage II sporulation protein E (SpoIIE)